MYESYFPPEELEKFLYLFNKYTIAGIAGVMATMLSTLDPIKDDEKAFLTVLQKFLADNNFVIIAKFKEEK